MLRLRVISKVQYFGKKPVSGLKMAYKSETKAFSCRKNMRAGIKNELAPITTSIQTLDHEK